GDDLAANQRRLHALGAHADAVGDGDGVELEGGSAGGSDALFDRGGEASEVEVAGADLDPGVGDADEWLREVIVGEAGGAEHGARGGAVRTVEQRVAGSAEVVLVGHREGS